MDSLNLYVKGDDDAITENKSQSECQKTGYGSQKMRKCTASFSGLL